ncbi:MAG: type II secretion system protein GspG [Spirochaetales bacterium]|nr:type II secretion system protein GspG [Spirochaetales bacterium]
MNGHIKKNKKRPGVFERLRKHVTSLTKRHPETGTTFVEILVTISIIAILMTTIAIAIIPWIVEAQKTTAKQHIGTFKVALQMYLAQNRSYPDQSEGLDSLKPYIQDGKIPKDPWGHEYIYMVPGPDGVDYGIQSYGPDGAEGGDDDITSWGLEANEEDDEP